MDNIQKFKLLFSIIIFCITINTTYAKQDIPTTVDTVNQIGWMFTGVFDNISNAYIEFAAKDPYPTLELGAGRGATAAELVKKRKFFKNNSEIVVNELSTTHLEMAAKEYPVLQEKMVKFLPGAFPEQLKFSEATFNSILASRFFHFLTPQEWQTGLKKIFYWLKPGGKFYITTGTYFINYQKNNIHLIEEKKHKGIEWPAYFKTGKEAYGPKSKSSVANLVDQEILERELKLIGFKILKSEYVDLRKYLPADFCLDGREAIGVIATK